MEISMELVVKNICVNKFAFHKFFKYLCVYTVYYTVSSMRNFGFNMHNYTKCKSKCKTHFLFYLILNAN